MNEALIAVDHDVTAARRHSQVRVFMDTAVSVNVWARVGDTEVEAAIDRAFTWFGAIEGTCSRFDLRSELARLSATVGRPAQVSALLFEPLRFALAVAEATGGAFDPTVGDSMAQRGFTRNYRTGEDVARSASCEDTCYRDVVLDESRHEVTLVRPLTLDLGGVAKGMALDLAGQELSGFQHYVIDAGGDLLFGGGDPAGGRWCVDIRHPRDPDAIVRTLRVRDTAVCTSGAYQRPRPDGPSGHHLLDPRTRDSAMRVLSATVIAQRAIVADAMATAAFVMGPDARPLLEAQGLDACFVLPSFEIVETCGFERRLG